MSLGLTFEQWLEVKRNLQEDFDSPDDPTNIFKFNHNKEDFGTDYENTQKEVSKLVMSKYARQFLRFMGDLAEEHNDQELKELLRKLETDGGEVAKDGWKPDHPDDGEAIVPPTADRGIDPNSVD